MNETKDKLIYLMMTNLECLQEFVNKQIPYEVIVNKSEDKFVLGELTGWLKKFNSKPVLTAIYKELTDSSIDKALIFKTRIAELKNLKVEKDEFNYLVEKAKADWMKTNIQKTIQDHLAVKKEGFETAEQITSVVKKLNNDLQRINKTINKETEQELSDELTAKAKSELTKNIYQANTPEQLLAAGQNIVNKINSRPQEVVFDFYKKGDIVQTEVIKTFKIGNAEFDSYSPFEKESVCLLAGLTGSGKTTVALNFAKAFQENNSDCDILFLESESETSPQTLKEFAKKIDVKELPFAYFPRFENMQKGFMNILDAYKKSKGKYPDVVFIDTFEKMNASAENYSLKLNTEVLSYICQITKCLFISLSQFSSTQFKSSKHQSNYYPMSIQQGGMDVINNVNTWISMKRETEAGKESSVYYNNFYFGKVRNSNSSVNLYDKYIRVPFRLNDFNLLFKNLELKEDVQ